MSEQEQKQVCEICKDVEELNRESRRALEAFKAGIKVGLEIAQQTEQQSA